MFCVVFVLKVLYYEMFLFARHSISCTRWFFLVCLTIYVETSGTWSCDKVFLQADSDNYADAKRAFAHPKAL